MNNYYQIIHMIMSDKAQYTLVLLFNFTLDLIIKRKDFKLKKLIH